MLTQEVRHIRVTPAKVNISAEELSQKVFEFLINLKEIDSSLFSQWYEKGNTRQEALENKIPLESSFFTEKIKKKWDKKFPDLGSSIGFWNGNIEDEKSSDISFRLGVTSKNKNINNNISISFPSFKELRITKDDERIFKIKRLITYIWDPLEIKVSYFE